MGIKLLVVEEYAIVSDAIIRLLKNESDIEVVGEARSGAQALELAQRTQPDVMLVDIHLSDMDGIEVTRSIKRILPTTQVILLSDSEEEEEILEAVQAGARGYISKRTNAETLIDQVRRVVSGGVGLSEEMTAKLITGLMHKTTENHYDGGDPMASLTEREKEILALISQGIPNKKIASLLFVSENTVRAHVRSLMQKLNADNRTQLAIFALRAGLTETHQPRRRHAS